MKKIVIAFVVILFIGYCIIKVGKQAQDYEAKEGAKTEANTVREWDYYKKVDKMTSDTVYNAELLATNILYFKQPYDGGSWAKISLHKQKNSLIIMFSVAKGQFVFNSDGGAINARFDNDKAKFYFTHQSSDYSKTDMFINDPSAFLTNLKTHKKLLVETEFFQDGVRVIEFNIENLKWK